MDTVAAAPLVSEPPRSRRAALLGRLPKRRPLGPGMALYLLSPIVAELCLGATPILSYLVFGWMLTLMYGGGAILIRESAIRWGKGWPTIFTLGLAYAISEEGVAVRTFFDRTSPALKPLGDYGWAGGANWVWITHLSLYHAVISIALPIFLVTLAYPARRKEPWVSDSWLKKAAVGYVAVITFWLVAYKLPVQGGLVIGAFAAMALLVWLARRLPETIDLGRWSAGAGSAPSPRRVAIVAFAATCGVFALDWGRGFGLPAAAAVLAMVAIASLAGWWFVRGSSGPGWTDRQRYAIAAGVLAFLPLFSPIVELLGGRGQIVVGIVTAYLLRRTWRRLREREAGAPESTATTFGEPVGAAEVTATSAGQPPSVAGAIDGAGDRSIPSAC
jgi:hypothetical protein